jgi:hypothetical protein
MKREATAEFRGGFFMQQNRSGTGIESDNTPF